MADDEVCGALIHGDVGGQDDHGPQRRPDGRRPDRSGTRRGSRVCHGTRSQAPKRRKPPRPALSSSGFLFPPRPFKNSSQSRISCLTSSTLPVSFLSFFFPFILFPRRQPCPSQIRAPTTTSPNANMTVTEIESAKRAPSQRAPQSVRPFHPTLSSS